MKLDLNLYYCNCLEYEVFEEKKSPFLIKAPCNFHSCWFCCSDSKKKEEQQVEMESNQGEHHSAVELDEEKLTIWHSHSLNSRNSPVLNTRLCIKNQTSGKSSYCCVHFLSLYILILFYLVTKLLVRSEHDQYHWLTNEFVLAASTPPAEVNRGAAMSRTALYKMLQETPTSPSLTGHRNKFHLIVVTMSWFTGILINKPSVMLLQYLIVHWFIDWF